MSDIKELINISREILKWTKFSSIGKVREILSSILDTDQKRLIYHLSDGENGSVEIANIVQVSDSTVRRYWNSWFRIGVVEPLSVRGGTRYKKSFDLEDFGFIIPEVKFESEEDN
jgi:Fic family protein